ncbi:hypothetical protein [Pseudobutyrivibrio sp. LB2011]|uniref:hypothetical protein n=1 Tax=Pseudobutyrivibrio sp. LB2011 TaxID=1408312 RepID=UPI0005D27F3F|nr:hypothetical protein [Pseudobutyrivibrio sp. LB2011]
MKYIYSEDERTIRRQGMSILKEKLGVEGVLRFLSTINEEYEEYLSEYDSKKDRPDFDYLDYIIEGLEKWEDTMSEYLVNTSEQNDLIENDSLGRWLTISTRNYGLFSKDTWSSKELFSILEKYVEEDQ